MVLFETVVRKVRREERGGRTWFTAEIDPTSVNVEGERLQISEVTSQRAELGELVRRFRDSGQRVQIEAVHRAKPRQDGGVWHNFYLEHARAVGDADSDGGQGWEAPAASSDWDEPAPPPQRRRPPSPAAAASVTREKSPRERWEIALSVGAKLAVDCLPVLNDQSPEGQWALALFWATRIHTTPLPGEGPVDTVPPPSYTTRQSESQPGAYDEPETSTPPDSDIPW